MATSPVLTQAADARARRRRLLSLPAPHPVLFALLPVFLLYTGNINEVSLPDLLLPLAALAVVSLPVWWLCARLLRDPHRGAVLASLCWIWFFAYGAWRRWLDPEDETMALAAVIAYLALLLVPVSLARLRRSYLHASRAFTVIAVGLTALQLLTIARYETGRVRYAPPATAERLQGISLHPPAQPPDIYFIILDGYARADVMQEIYHYDNRPFLEFLKTRGFQVASDSRANYCQTLLSLASCLDLDYLDTFLKRMDARDGGRRPLDEALRSTRVRALLQQHGYDLAAFASGYEETDMPEA